MIVGGGGGGGVGLGSEIFVLMGIMLDSGGSVGDSG